MLNSATHAHGLAVASHNSVIAWSEKQQDATATFPLLQDITGLHIVLVSRVHNPPGGYVLLIVYQVLPWTWKSGRRSNVPGRWPCRHQYEYDQHAHRMQRSVHAEGAVPASFDRISMSTTVDCSLYKQGVVNKGILRLLDLGYKLPSFVHHFFCLFEL